METCSLLQEKGTKALFVSVVSVGQVLFPSVQRKLIAVDG